METSNTSRRRRRAATALFALLAALPVTAAAQTDWSIVSSPTTDVLRGIYMAAPTSGFAVGGSGTVLRYDGTDWTITNFVEPVPLTTVVGFDDGRVYALGGGVIYEFDGSTWAAMTPSLNANFNAATIWASPWNKLYAAGSGSSTFNPGGIATFDGAQWTYAVGSQQFAQSQLDVWGSAENALYALSVDEVRMDACTGVVGDFWGRAVRIGAGAKSIWGPGGGEPDVFVGSGTEIRYWDGQGDICTFSWAVKSSANSGAVRRIWGLSKDEIYAVGYDEVFNGQSFDDVASIYHGNSSNQWSRMSTPIDSDDIVLTDIHGADSTSVFAVGDGGTILRLQPSEPSDTLVVNTTSDAPDLPGDDKCDTGEPPVNGRPACSLRAAVQYANEKSGRQIIVFEIPGSAPYRIFADSAITISDSVTIDGPLLDGPPTRSSGAVNLPWPPIVVLDGSNAVDHSIIMVENRTVVSGLSIVNYTSHGIVVDGNWGRVEKCHIGTSIFGSADQGNGGSGVFIDAEFVTVGGFQAGNLISGNDRYGVEIQKSFATVRNNAIGLNFSGAAALPNKMGGVLVNDAYSTRIGYATSGPGLSGGNVISGNTGHGIELAGSQTYDSLIRRNIIGLSVDGMSKLPNTGHGVWIRDGANNNAVGSEESVERNIISGNDVDGIRIEGIGTNRNVIKGNYIGLNISGIDSLSNRGDGIQILEADSNVVGDGTPNVISGNKKTGVVVVGEGAVGNVIASNYIGTDVTQSVSLPNGRNAVLLRLGASGNWIGTGEPSGRNYITGQSNGVVLEHENTRNNRITGNFIGITLTRRIGNKGHGVLLSGAGFNTVGGDSPQEGNTIAGNDENGIWVSGAAADSVVIKNNLIGLSPTPVFTEDASNGKSGILISNGATRTQVAFNTISNNTMHGVFIDGGAAGTMNEARLTKNRIGIASDEEITKPNGESGVRVFNSGGNYIGDGVGTNGNTISGNTGTGVSIKGEFSIDNNILGNRIGTSSDGMVALGNVGFGVELDDRANFNIVGSASSTGRNIISGNMNSGVIVSDGARENMLLGNYIGTDTTGAGALPNRQAGVFIFKAPSNVIGSAEFSGNLISGNSNDGINIAGEGADSNHVEENLIGTDISGSCVDDGSGGCAMGNQNGVVIRTKAHDTVISRNTISGNRFNGVKIEGGVGDAAAIRRTHIVDNVIGLDSSGVAAVPNQRNGVNINTTRKTLFEGNVISGNQGVGVDMLSPATRETEFLGCRIGVRRDEPVAVPNQAGGVRVDGTTRTTFDSCVVSGNGDYGVKVEGGDVDSTLVKSCYVGCDETGSIAVPNEERGIWVTRQAVNTVIGGDLIEDRNVVSGNNGPGIEISDFAENTVVLGNLIGVKASATEALANQVGVVIDRAGRNRIGSTDWNSRNIISGNLEKGIDIRESGATENEVVGNYIGTDSSGTASVPNGHDGVRVRNARYNYIGLPEPGGGNLISGNSRMGVVIDGAGGGATFGNEVRNNLIGLDRSGETALPNVQSGVMILDARNNVIGGPDPAARNVISGNDENGVYILQNSLAGQECRYNIVQNNYIGTNLPGTYAVPNVFDGLLIEKAHYNLIGGRRGSEGNLISGNTGNGIHVLDSTFPIPALAGRNNRIQGNIIGWDAAVFDAVGNTGDGIFLDASDRNLVGGSSAFRNLISHCTLAVGIHLLDAKHNDVQSNAVTLNSTGIILGGTLANFNDIAGNLVVGNGCGVVGSGGTNGNLLTLNTVKGNQDDECTGVHLTSSAYSVVGNSITDDAGDGIDLGNGAAPEIRLNNIVNNALFGLTTDGMAPVTAQENWWGAPDGPGGVGPGSGDEVSAGVVFSNWLVEPVALVMSARDTIVVTPGTMDSVVVMLQNWAVPNDVADVTVADERGWVSPPLSFSVETIDTLAGSVEVVLAPPITATESSEVTIQGTSQADPSDTAEVSFTVLTYQPSLTEVVLFPDTLRVEPRETAQVVAEGYDQFGREYAFNRVWTTTGGSVDSMGVYTAPDFNGMYEVTVSNPDGSLGDETVVIVDGIEPLNLTLGVLPNPYFSQFLDIVVVGSQEIDPPSLQLDVDGGAVPMTEIDAGEHVWKADYELHGPGGAIAIDVCATSTLGTSDCAATTVAALRVENGNAAALRSPDGAMAIGLPGGSVLDDGYVVVIPQSRGSSLACYAVAGAAVSATPGVNVTFDLARLDLEPDTDLTRLSIVFDDSRPLNTVIDPTSNVARATLPGHGRVRIEVGTPGTARLADVRVARLGPGYPNPFNPRTTIPIELETPQVLQLNVYDVAGHLVAQLVDGTVPAGRNSVVWDGTDRRGIRVASGVYFVRLKTKHVVTSRKITLLK